MKHGTWYIVVAGLWLAACSSSDPADSNGQTHWLRECASDSQCGQFSCECGVCVAACAGNGSCDVAGRDTTCQPASSGAVAALCGSGAAAAMCLEPCGGGCDNGQRCVSGACIPAQSSGAAGAGAGGASAGEGSDAGRGGSGAGGRGGSSAGAGGAIAGSGGSSGAGAGGAGTGSGGVGGASGAGQDAGLACIASQQRCEVADDQCCAGTSCWQTVCTNAIPPSCFGECRAGGGKLDAGNPGGDVPCGPGALRCKSGTEVCVSQQAFMTSYACKPIPASCNGKPSCECLVDSACDPGFKTCNDDDPDEIACICIAC